MNSFSKKERLCSKKLIELLFSSGKTVSEFPFRVKYHLFPATDEVSMQILFSVPKKTIKRAVNRNLIRRRAKEVFRLNKHHLYNKIPQNHKLILAFVYIDKDIQSFEVIKNGIIKCIDFLSFC